MKRIRVSQVLVAAVALAGCSAGPSMVTGSPPATPQVAMMGGYRYSTLTCSAPVLPGSVVSVTLADMGMMAIATGTAPLGVHMMLQATPASIPAGQVSLVASNVGWRTHELVVLPLSGGQAAGARAAGADGKVDEASSLGEASNPCAGGSGDGISARSVGWVTLTLAPGRYELVCNLANHYADGMHTELDVT